jgi:hypothetical protein
MNARRIELAKEAARLEGIDYKSASRTEKARYLRLVNSKLRENWDLWDEMKAARNLIAEIKANRG